MPSFDSESPSRSPGKSRKKQENVGIGLMHLRTLNYEKDVLLGYSKDLKKISEKLHNKNAGEFDNELMKLENEYKNTFQKTDEILETKENTYKISTLKTQIQNFIQEFEHIIMDYVANLDKRYRNNDEYMELKKKYLSDFITQPKRSHKGGKRTQKKSRKSRKL
jgi:hypothetical protein